jgi:hypothetical protein
MANYKEEMKLTDEEIEAVKPTQEECAKITAAMELYKPPEFKGCFANDEYDKLTKRKIAEAQFKKLQPIIVAQRAEIDGWNSLEKKLCPPGYTYETYIKKLEGGLIDEERKVVAAFNIEIADLKLQLSTARAEIAKEITDIFLDYSSRLSWPAFNRKYPHLAGKKLKEIASYLAPDKEGGK